MKNVVKVDSLGYRYDPELPDFDEEAEELTVPSFEPPRPSGFKPVETEGKKTNFTEQDLTTGQMYQNVQEYMFRRFGSDYDNRADPQAVVDDFLSYQRGLEVGNSWDLVREMNFIRDADEKTKDSVGRAYRTFENLEGIFDDGFTLDAAGDLTDYVSKVIVDPLTFLTAGGGKVFSAIGQRAAAQTVRRAFLNSSKAVLRSGATREITLETAKRTSAEVLKNITRRRANQAVAGAALTEGVLSVGQYVGTENIREMGNDQYNADTSVPALATAFVAAAVPVGVGGVLATRLFGPNKGYSKYIPSEQAKGVNKKVPKGKKQEVAAKAIENFIKMLSQDEWAQAVERGASADGKGLSSDLLRTFLLGRGGSRGIVDFMVEADATMKADKFSHNIVSFIKDLPEESKTQLDQLFRDATSGLINSVDEFSDMFARTAERAGVNFNLMSQASKYTAKATVEKNAIDQALRAAAGEATDDALENLKDTWLGSRWGEYTQNVWRRMLVSNIATTGTNIFGSSLYAAGQTASDLIGGAGQLARGLVTGDFTAAKAYKGILAGRMRNLFSPEQMTSNRQIFEAIVKKFPSTTSSLRDTINMGMKNPESIEQLFKQYQFTGEQSQAFVKNVEGVVDTVQQFTFVKAQDSWFKTFGLIDNLNRISWKKHGKSVYQILEEGDFQKLIDEDDIGLATHATMKMTFSADYTTRNRRYHEAGRALSSAVGAFENFVNNTPLSYVFPFARFANNVMANTYHFSPLPLAAEMYRSVRKIKPNGILKDRSNVINHSIAGTAMMTLAYQLAVERAEQGLPWNIYDTTAGRVDVTNMYPASFIAYSGEFLRRLFHDEPITSVEINELGRQIALGQVADDINVVDFVRGSMQTISELAQEGSQGRFSASSLNPVLAAVGSVAAGFTRPLDTINLAAGVITNDLQTYDRNQIDGPANAFTSQATRYVDRIINALVVNAGGELPDDFEYVRDATMPGPKTEGNPVLRSIATVRTSDYKSYTQEMLDMAGKPYWTEQIRSVHPEYNRLANEYVAPLLDYMAFNMVRSDEFINADQRKRQNMITNRIRQLREQVAERIESGIKPHHWEWHLERRLLSMQENPQQKLWVEEAIRNLGLITSNPRNMTPQDKVRLLEQIEIIRFKYQ